MNSYIDDRLKSTPFSKASQLLLCRECSRDAGKVSVQVKVADGAQLALVDIEIKLKCLEAQSVHTMHDEISIETKAEIAEEVVEIV
jgi:DNA polymerase I-like protein with 3'-5' exonuclease and polymerase domains